jgi:hypothetical protein
VFCLWGSSQHRPRAWTSLAPLLVGLAAQAQTLGRRHPWTIFGEEVDARIGP